MVLSRVRIYLPLTHLGPKPCSCWLNFFLSYTPSPSEWFSLIIDNDRLRTLPKAFKVLSSDFIITSTDEFLLTIQVYSRLENSEGSSGYTVIYTYLIPCMPTQANTMDGVTTPYCAYNVIRNTLKKPLVSY